jgi:hypothetical protein
MVLTKELNFIFKFWVVFDNLNHKSESRDSDR